MPDIDTSNFEASKPEKDVNAGSLEPILAELEKGINKNQRAYILFTR